MFTSPRSLKLNIFYVLVTVILTVAFISADLQKVEAATSQQVEELVCDSSSDWQYIEDINSPYYNSTNYTAYNKTFPSQSGPITLEFTLKANTNGTLPSHGLFVSLGDSDTHPFLTYIELQGDYLYVFQNSTWDMVTLKYPINTNIKYGVKVIANPTSHTADIYVDGIFITTVNFIDNSSNSISNIAYGYPKGNCSFEFSPKIYKGFLVNESFDTTRQDPDGIYDPIDYPHDWSLSVPSGSTASVEDVPLYSLHNWMNPDLKNIPTLLTDYCKSFKMCDNSTTSGIQFSKTFTAQTGKTVFEFKFMQPVDTAKMDGFNAELLSGSTNVLKIFTSGSYFYYKTSASSTKLQLPNSSYHCDYKQNVWYLFKIVADVSNKTADIYIDGVKRNTIPVPFLNNVSSISKIKFSTDSAVTGTTWLDDIKVYPNIVYQTVPAPNPVSTGDITLGCQTYDSMRGSWDGMNLPPYSWYAKPLLGWYDSASPEAADWQIKFATEHGIKYWSVEWYRDSVGGPLLDPRYNSIAAELAGFFDAQYKDYMKFCIDFCPDCDDFINDTNNGQPDMMTNLLPAWVEWFFKNPNYFTVEYIIDGESVNVPVLQLYGPEHLLSDLGDDPATVNSLFTLMRDYCKTEGIGVSSNGNGPGLAIWANMWQGSYDQSSLESSINSCGFDRVFTYARFGATSDQNEAIKINTDHIDLQIAEHQAGRAPLPVPGLGQGWNPVSYTDSSNYKLTPASFKTAAQYLKNSLQDSIFANAPGGKIAQIDGWGEYGEGHWIMPTTDPNEKLGTRKLGFGYLDAIRQALAVSPPTDNDVLPPDVGLQYPNSDLYPHPDPYTMTIFDDTTNCPGNYYWGEPFVYDPDPYYAPGTWTALEDANAYNGYATITTTLGSSCTYTFDDTYVDHIAIYGGWATDYGTANIIVDGVDCGPTDFSWQTTSTTPKYDIYVDSSWYPDALSTQTNIHTIQITANGDGKVSIDRVVVYYKQ